MKNLKALMEKRAELKTEMDALVATADGETRAMNPEEGAKFDTAEKSIADIDATIAREERARAIEHKEFKADDVPEDRAVIEERSFLNYIKSECGMPVENRAGEENFTIANNGALLPTTIANRVISAVKEMCPILEKSTIFSVKGTLKVPVYGLASGHDITVAYGTEFTDLAADAGKFTSVDLTGYLTGALSLIGKSVITNSSIDVVAYVVNEMAKKIALFLEKELLNGTADKATGALSTSATVLAGSVSAITADKLIELQAKVPSIYQAAACWTMKPATFVEVRKLKDGNGQYLLQNNFSQDFPYAILGKPVYLSDNMPAIGSGNKAVLYGDYSGLGVNIRQNIEMQILLEKYAIQHAVGIVSWFEFDSKVIDNQKLATLTMSVS